MSFSSAGTDEDGAPAGRPERRGQGQPPGVEDGVVADLVGDREAGLERGVRQPAEAAERRRGEVGAAAGEPRGAEPGRGAVDRCGHRGSEARVLEGDATVALDEDDEHVLALQAGEEALRGGRRVRVARGQPLELGAVRDPLAQVPHVVGGDRAGLGGRDPQVRAGRRAEDGGQGPDDPDHDDPRRGGSPVSGRCSRHPDRGEREQDERRQGGHPQGDGDEDGADTAHAVAQDAVARADVRRVGQRVERAVEADQHADVEDLQQGDDRDGHAHDGRDDGPGLRREDQAEHDEDEDLEGYAGPGPGGQLLRPVRQVQRRDEHSNARTVRTPTSRCRGGAALGAAGGLPSRARVSVSATGRPGELRRQRRRCRRGRPAVLMARAGQPHDVLPERLREQHEGANRRAIDSAAGAARRRRPPGTRPGCGHDLAPVARRDGGPQPPPDPLRRRNSAYRADPIASTHHRPPERPRR